MKRSAEKQLTKDHSDDDEVEEVDPSQGFKKADQSSLSARPMRGLPKRGNATGVPQLPLFGASSSETNPSNPDSGFKPFGSASSTPFTFSAPSTASPMFSTTQSSSTNDSPFTFATNAAVSSSASPATKQFASFLGSQPNGTSTPSLAPRPATSGVDKAAITYYSSLRGLNKSFKDAVSKAIDSDPLGDLTGILDQYKSIRSTIQKEFDDGGNPRGSVPINGTSSSPTPMFGSKPNLSAPQSSSAPSLPKPPASFTGFGLSSSASTPSVPSTSMPAPGGFKPNFGLTTATSNAPTPFSFEQPATSEKTLPTSPFTLPSSSATGAKLSLFGSSDSPPKPSPFGGTSTPSSSSPFGSLGATSASKPTSVFGSGGAFGGASSTAKPETVSNSPSLFGGSGPVGSTFSATGSASGGFVFGAKAAAKGNLGNPVGFSFGSNTPTPEPEGASAAADEGASKSAAGFAASTSSPAGFTFGSSATAGTSGSQRTSATKSPTPFSTSSAGDSRGVTPSAEGGETSTDGDVVNTKVLGENPNDLEGEGEQDEESLHTSRVKIYKFGKKDGQPHWAEVGVGMLRIKKHKVSGAKRMLSRNSANGKIMMNFKLYSGLKVTRSKQVLNFVGHDEGVNTTYRVRVKDEAGAIALKEAIEKEAPA
ncbi:hypothetical protein DFH11DRAFT_1722790 [Phellopilus nigrolimitatus]|nr:hypothetical protein DFH11DRAFT_1722790 [Phellopilus nigrolimitatus]